MEEGHRPEINTRVLEFPNPGGVAVLQEGREKRGSGVLGGCRGVDKCMRYDEIRAGRGRRGVGEERRDELLMAQQVWPPLGNTGA